MQTIAHNLPAQFTDRQLNITNKNKEKSTERLSSGYRINRAADDTAGLQISEKMRWQIRGLNKASNNIQDGGALLQVADGALSEVHDMLHRLNELVIQAANDTNTAGDRQDIQKEINALIEEIDRIGNDTEFNTRKIFQGGMTDVLDEDGNPVRLCDIPITDFQLRGSLGNVNLTNAPLRAGDGQYLNLGTVLTENYTDTRFDLIYDSGYTSYSSIKVEYQDADGNQVTVIKNMDELELEEELLGDGRGNGYERRYRLKDNNGLDIKFHLRLNIGAHTGTSQDYRFRFLCNNSSDMDVKVSYMFNADSAYNNDDNVEGYFVNGQQINNFSVYTNNQDYIDQNSAYVKDMNQFGGNSFSIVDVDNALPFAVKVGWSNTTSSLDTISIGDYYKDTYKWGYYDNLTNNLGGSTEHEDLAFSLIFKAELGSNMQSMYANLADFTYGITQTSTDSNLAGVPITYNQTSKVHTDVLDLWIQSGATNRNGMFISIGEMNAGTLGIRGLNATTFERAQSAISSVQSAIKIVSDQRSMIGAQQNRLEHAMTVDDNTSENTQAAESRLRDADMAEEMVNYARHSILQQAGQSMLTQANQIPNGIIQLLQ